jgi:hypothetical protein
MEQIWFKDPAGLITPSTWSRFVPTKEMTIAEALNSVVRFTTYFAVILFLATGLTAYILAVPAVMLVTMLLYNLFPNGKTIESFTLPLGGATGGATARATMPTGENPFMNVLLTEIMDDPDRPDAANGSKPEVKAAIHAAFQKTSDLYMDTSDLFDQTQAMRTFHTLQSSRVPNDLEGFKKWLAKDQDAPNISTAPPARNAKTASEGYVVQQGTLPTKSPSTSRPTGVSPSSPAARTAPK